LIPQSPLKAFTLADNPVYGCDTWDTLGSKMNSASGGTPQISVLFQRVLPATPALGELVTFHRSEEGPMAMPGDLRRAAKTKSSNCLATPLPKSKP
jgi:hypothetical protein